MAIENMHAAKPLVRGLTSPQQQQQQQHMQVETITLVIVSRRRVHGVKS
jgi:hypothetical protein